MIDVRARHTTHHLALGFVVGAALTALFMLATAALAQTPTLTPISVPNVQAMIDVCRAMMGSVGSTMQGMMSGVCPMMGR
jgi:hypothetical protein